MGSVNYKQVEAESGVFDVISGQLEAAAARDKQSKTFIRQWEVGVNSQKSQTKKTLSNVIKGRMTIADLSTRDILGKGSTYREDLEGLVVEDYEIIQTQSHLLLRKDETTGDLDPTPFLIDFAASKLRVSRQWNTQIAQLGGDRFSSLWKLASVSTENRAGQKFQNLSAVKQGWVTEEDYAAAKKVYEGVSAS